MKYEEMQEEMQIIMIQLEADMLANYYHFNRQ